jgi:peptidoglycan hydrolase-like protein with peptidoglycan-binding domain
MVAPQTMLGVETVSDQIQPWPMVKQGSQGHPVPTLQYLLGAHGRRVTADGIFGPMTKAAVRSFQHAIGIAVDGIVGPLTWRALISGMLSL